MAQRKTIEKIIITPNSVSMDHWHLQHLGAETPVNHCIQCHIYFILEDVQLKDCIYSPTCNSLSKVEKSDKEMTKRSSGLGIADTEGGRTDDGSHVPANANWRENNMSTYISIVISWFRVPIFSDYRHCTCSFHNIPSFPALFTLEIAQVPNPEEKWRCLRTC